MAVGVSGRAPRSRTARGCPAADRLQKLLWRRWATLFDLQVDLRRRDAHEWTQIFLQRDREIGRARQRRAFWVSRRPTSNGNCAVAGRRRESRNNKNSRSPDLFVKKIWVLNAPLHDRRMTRGRTVRPKAATEASAIQAAVWQPKMCRILRSGGWAAMRCVESLAAA